MSVHVFCRIFDVLSTYFRRILTYFDEAAVLQVGEHEAQEVDQLSAGAEVPSAAATPAGPGTGRVASAHQKLA